MDNYEMSVWMQTQALTDTLLVGDMVPVPWLPGTWISLPCFVEASSSLIIHSFHLASKIYFMFISLVVPLFDEVAWRKSGGDG